MSDEFMGASLWQRTLGAEGAPGSAQRERLRSSYLVTRESAARLMSEQAATVREFTVHDISHVDALWESADLICGDSASLTPAEAYVLGCAFVFHDAAMGTADLAGGIAASLGERRWRDLLASRLAEENGSWPGDEELDRAPANVVHDCELAAIRETHATRAKGLVDRAWTTSAGNSYYLIQETEFREKYGPLIADLASSHGKNIETVAGEFKDRRGALPGQPASWLIDPLKLACILRVADLIQLDSRRAPTFLFALRNPAEKSRRHWRFQEHIALPLLKDDRLQYTAWRAFERSDAAAWWLALDYLRYVDRELKAVDALLHDYGRERLAARAVSGVDSPERFAERFRVSGWRPIDAGLKVSSIEDLAAMLGGEQLYGHEPELAIRELIQNGQDAVMARRAVDRRFTGSGSVTVRLWVDEGRWTLEVADDGIGMDEAMLTTGLLDFGRSGWMTDLTRATFPGLMSTFQPKGRFGIGFFSIFMLGDEVEVVTRRHDVGIAEARRLTFEGIKDRPILSAVRPEEDAPVGTTVRVVLRMDPYDDDDGIFKNTADETIQELVQILVPESTVPVGAVEPNTNEVTTLSPFRLATATADGIFDRLYPPQPHDGENREAQRQVLRKEFSLRATEITDDTGARVGLGVLGYELYFASEGRLSGLVLTDGLYADRKTFFTGYISCPPNRASRSGIDLVPLREGLRRWIVTQRAKTQEIPACGVRGDLESACMLYLASGVLTDRHHVGLGERTAMTLEDVETLARGRDQIFLVLSLPIQVTHEAPHGIHLGTGAPIHLSSGQIIPVNHYGIDVEFQLALGRRRDPRFEYARRHRTRTWERTWWRQSDLVTGAMLERICKAWSCSIEDILAPVAERSWNDESEVFAGRPVKVYGYNLRRPPRP